MIIKSIRNQSINDLCISCNGTRDALAQLIADNITGDFQLDAVLVEGVNWVYNTDNGVADKKALKKLAGIRIDNYRPSYFE